MKILHTVEYYYPSKGGSQEVVRQLSEHMVSKGHDVTVATTRLPKRQHLNIGGVKIKEFDIHGNSVRGYSGTDISAYKRYLIDSKFDIIMNYAAQEWTADLTFEVLNRINSKKVLIPCGYSGLHNPDYLEYYKHLPNVLSAYDATVYTSGHYRDIDFAKEHNVPNLHVIPNGADEKEFSNLSNYSGTTFREKYHIKKDQFVVLTIGTHTGIKGHRETITAFQRANMPNSTLIVVGNHGPCHNSCKRMAMLNNIRHKNNKIVIIDIDREETIQAYNASDVFLFLSNVECSPLVLFESAASATPFISSDVGNSREIAEWTGGGIIVNSIENSMGYKDADMQMAIDKLLYLFKDKKARVRLGDKARRKWKSNYTWEKITNDYLTLYRELLANN